MRNGVKCFFFFALRYQRNGVNWIMSWQRTTKKIIGKDTTMNTHSKDNWVNFLKLWDWCISFLLHLIVVFVRTSRERESASWRRTSPLIVILGRRVRLGAWGWKNVLERWSLHTLNKESSRFSWKRWIKAWSSSTTALISEIHYGVVNAEVALHIFRQRSLRVNKGRKSIRP